MPANPRLHTFLFLLMALQFSGVCLYAWTPLSREVLEKIKTRNGYWNAYQGEVVLHFVTSENRQAVCEGTLTYQRLNEKMLLRCFNKAKQPLVSRGSPEESNGQLLFILKTFDENYDLYQPATRAVYSGNIFDLENSRDIESHLKPLDLYRALKFFAVPEDAFEIEDSRGKSVLASVKGNRGILSSYIHAQGQFGELMSVVAEDRQPLEQKNLMVRLPYVVMQGQELFKIAVNSMAEAVTIAAKKAKLKLSDIDYLIPHQANDRIISAVAKKLKFPKEKIFINIDRYGNM